MFLMFKQRSRAKELMDELDLTGEALRQNLDELETINNRLGGNAVVIDAFEKLYKQQLFKENKTYTIADVGTGGGDVLRALAIWLRKKNIKTKLIGLDANDFMIEYAIKKAILFPEIEFLRANVFDKDFENEKYDFVLCSLFCHHFTDDELVVLFQKFVNKSSIALIINDLHRHFLAYYGIKFLTWLFRGSYLVRNDAPLSVLRAFKKHELKQLFHAANINNSEIKWQWAFRFRVIVKKN